MLRWSLIMSVCLLAGCQAGEPPMPPVAPMPEDLSTWSAPELAQPVERPVPLPPRATKVAAGAAEKVVNYAPGVTVEVSVALGAPLDIVLEAGEQVRQIVDGDRAPTEEGQPHRWQVREGGDGAADDLRPHIFVTASAVGLTNGVTITTTRRTYYLTCKSVGKSAIRVLRWHYPQEHATLERPTGAAAGLLPSPEQPRQYHTGYEVRAHGHPAPGWMPRQVVDDGKKLYLIYPEVTLFATVPLVRMLGPSGPQLVNSRQYLNVVILDQLAPAVELRVGVGDTAEVVTITRGAGLRTITCPDEGAACPQWPSAVQQFTRRFP